MTTVAFVVFVLAVIVMVVTHALSMRRMEGRVHARQVELDKADEGRRQALYQQQKAAQTAIAQQQTSARVLADQTRALHEDTRLMLQRVDALASDAKKG